MRIFIAAILVTLLVVPFAFGEVYSNTVGLYKIDLVMNRNLVSMPFLPFNAALDEVIGDQLTGHPVNQWLSDKIERWDPVGEVFEGAWYREGVGWVAWDTMDGTPVDFNPDESYWIKIKNTPTTLALLGEVSETDRVISLILGRNLVAPSFPRAITFDNSGLLASGFTGHVVNQWLSDKIEFWNAAGQIFVGVWHRTGEGWRQWDSMDNPPVSPYDEITPGVGFWINVKNAAFTWTAPKPY